MVNECLQSTETENAVLNGPQTERLRERLLELDGYCLGTEPIAVGRISVYSLTRSILKACPSI